MKNNKNKNVDRLYKGLDKACQEGKEYNWKELCELIGFKYSYGNSKISDIKFLNNVCKIEMAGNKFKIVEVHKPKIIEEIIELCKKYEIDIIGGLDRVVDKYDRFDCKCNYHVDGQIKRMNLAELRSGNRQFNCCKFQINGLQASIYLYIKKNYPDAELIIENKKPVIIKIPSLNKNIIFINKRYSIEKNDNDIYLSLNINYKEPVWKGNILIYRSNEGSFSERKRVYHALSERVHFEYKNDNWASAIMLMLQHRAKKNINISNGKTYVVKVKPTEGFGEKIKFEAPPIEIDRNDLAHIVIVNSRMELKGEFNSYSEIIDNIKQGKFLDFLCLID